MPQNPDLLRISQSLNDVANQIHSAAMQTDDPGAYLALNNELIEVNHRITMVGAVIFAQRSQAVAGAAQQVEASKGEIEQAIQDIADISQFLQAASSFLGLVDTAIDLAKAA